MIIIAYISMMSWLENHQKFWSQWWNVLIKYGKKKESLLPIKVISVIEFSKIFIKNCFSNIYFLSNMSIHQDFHIIHNEYTGDSILVYQKKPIYVFKFYYSNFQACVTIMCRNDELNLLFTNRLSARGRSQTTWTRWGR